MKITIRIHLINRFRPEGLPEYKKKRHYKFPLYARTNDKEHLNIFEKTVNVLNKEQIKETVNREIFKIRDANTNFEIKGSPDYGDKLVGCISVWEYDDWYYQLFIPVKSNK